MLTVLAVLSLLAGNLIAIAQSSIRRMLAYSAIANVGFILLGFVTAGAGGYRAALVYTLVYVLTTLGSFAVVLLAARDATARPKSSTTTRDWARAIRCWRC